MTYEDREDFLEQLWIVIAAFDDILALETIDPEDEDEIRKMRDLSLKMYARTQEG
jgi:hypothetical protein